MSRVTLILTKQANVCPGHSTESKTNATKFMLVPTDLQYVTWLSLDLSQDGLILANLGLIYLLIRNTGRNTNSKHCPCNFRFNSHVD